jgi:hypothetical protein
MARRDDTETRIDPRDPPDWLDGDAPYEAVDVDELPDWWADAVEEFRAHGLRPYKPPRFSDDVLVPPVVHRLESAHGVEIRFMGVGVRYGDAWGVYVDGDVIATVDRERTADGHTRYETTSEAFERVVRDHLDADCGATLDSE